MAHKTLSVLVVEDSKTLREGYDSILRAEDHTPTLCSNAEEALEHIDRGEKFDFIYSDYQLPGMTGLEFLKCVRARDTTHHTPFALCTATAQPYLRMRCQDLGAVFFEKPVNILSVIEETLKKKE